MKLTDIQYETLKVMVESRAKIDEDKGITIKLEDIKKYIDQTIPFSGLIVDDEDYKKLFTDMEYRFKIQHTPGKVIFNDYEEQPQWYYNKDIKDPYFWNRYYNYLLKNSNIDDKSIKILDAKTLPQIMNCIGNPKDSFEGKRLKRGLIIGDVQSGKTATYTGLICKAADAGYKVVILLAGITESLRQQTQERIDEGIIGYTYKKFGKQIKKGNVGVGSDNKPIKATAFTSCVSDFTSNSDKIATTLGSHKSLVLFVIKKNVSVLSKLLSWLEEHNLDPVKGYVDQPMLLIDDEADNASVNTRKDETDPTKTNRLIREICDIFKNANYVGFTATPFANVFIDPDSVDSMKRADLFPEHFIYVLPTPSSYIGASKIFYKEGEYHNSLRYITDIEEPDYDSDEFIDEKNENPDILNSGPFYYKHLKEWRGIIPESLRKAVLCYFMANAVRDLRGDSEKPRSMLVNMSRFVKVQKYIKEYIDELYLNFESTVRYDFSEDSSKNTELPLYKELQSLWNENYSNIIDIRFERVINRQTLLDAIANIEIMVVNGGKNSGKLDYKINKSLRVIAVGGLALSRGLTLEGLLVSYFYRNTSTFDVLMQMGRWFGYRHGYSDLFRIWISKLSADWYGDVASASQELKDDISKMYQQKLTPKDFGIKVRDYTNELQITASNKMRRSYSYFEQYSFYGNMFDTPYVSRNIQQNLENKKAVSELASRLFSKKYDFRFTDQKSSADKDVCSDSDKSRYFADVPQSEIVDFLQRIHCSLMNMNFNIDNILDFIQDPKNVGLDKWDVVFEGGEGQDFYDISGLQKIRCIKRAIYPNHNVIQISSRRRLTGTREGKFTLTTQQIKEAETKCRESWNKENGGTIVDQKREIPLRAYFKYLPDRKPVLIIMLVEVESKPNKDKEIKASEKNKFDKFVEELGNDKLVAFAIGFPGNENREENKLYKVNKIYQKMYMLDEPDEIDEE